MKKAKKTRKPAKSIRPRKAKKAKKLAGSIRPKKAKKTRKPARLRKSKPVIIVAARDLQRAASPQINIKGESGMRKSHKSKRMHGAAKKSHKSHRMHGGRRRKHSRGGRLLGASPVSMAAVKNGAVNVLMGGVGLAAGAFVLKSLPATLNPQVRNAIPLAAGVLLAGIMRNPLIQSAAMGLGALGAYKLVSASLPALPSLAGDDVLQLPSSMLGEDIMGDVRTLGDNSGLGEDIMGDVRTLGEDMEGDDSGMGEDMEGDDSGMGEDMEGDDSEY